MQTSLAPTDPLLAHLRVSEPHPGILAYYDGRVAGHRFMSGDNWVDDGALELGIASYAILRGDAALVYDSHVSVPHAMAIRADLLARGVRDFTVILSHWHLDHVAGTAAFPGAPVIANRRTHAHLTERQAAIEAGTDHGPPAIAPLILPDRLFSDRLEFDFHGLKVVLIEANVHSDDATLLWLPETRVLLAGDTVEDCVTYVGAPEDFSIHRRDLDRMLALDPLHVLPNHGAAEVIASGGYGPGLITATQDYIAWLQGLDPWQTGEGPAMEAVLAKDFAAGTLIPFAPYERVHQQNIARSRAAFREPKPPAAD
jgi:cyclase